MNSKVSSVIAIRNPSRGSRWQRCIAYAALVSAAMVSGHALGQSYPAKPIRLIVPLAPGSTADIVSRYAGEQLAKAMQLIGETGIRNVEVYAGRESEAVEGEVARLSQRSWDSYTASIQLTDELWFQGSYKQEAAGAVAGTQARSGISGTLDWRFAPAWSANTEVGMLGVGLDLLWQHRY
jgi:hypothetical protein